MVKPEYKVIGVMSGTSLDGIDLIYLTFNINEFWSFKIHQSETVSYSADWKNSLQNLVSLSDSKLEKIDTDYTAYLSEIINDFIEKYSIENIDAVCSHGHTALHQPEIKLTYQIGNQSEIAKLINQKVICDFRVQDVEFGGQGAPLVPIGDKLLFQEFDFCVNFGGFANISTETDSKSIAFDICPVNIVLNHYVNKIGLDYDDRGEIASTGIVNNELFNELNELDFYKLNHPKSLGLEWVNEIIIPLIDSHQLDIKDILRTFVEHIAIQISDEINKKNNASVLITGGGVFNQFLINRIQQQTKNKIVIPSRSVIEYKEAIIFGLLGVLKLRNEVNCLSSVTGANCDHSSGKIFND